MDDLEAIQENFQAYLLRGQSDIEHSVAKGGPIPVATRLAIYKDAYTARLMETLTKDYPCLQTILGEDAFEIAAMGYVEANPSHFRSLRWFGKDFAQYFIKSKAAKYLAELADFEWKISLAFDAADATPFPLEQMANIPHTAWPSLRMIPQPSLQRINVFTNAISLWQQVMNKETLDSPVQNSLASPWLIWRSEYVPRFCVLTAEEAWAMDSMISGASFAELCEGLHTFVGNQDASLSAASLLKRWILSGWLSDIVYTV